MDISAAIIAGHSIAGISLGDDMDSVIRDLDSRQIPYAESKLDNDGVMLDMIVVLSGAVTVVSDDSRKIFRLACGPGYLGKYDGIFHPGMTVREVCEKSSHQLTIHGFLVVNKEFGAFFNIPAWYEGEWYDDIDSVEELPPEMRLDELNVKDRDWW